MKMKLMTPEAIKEIESLIPDHEEALMRWGAQMYREGIVKGAILVGTGMMLGTIAREPHQKHCYSFRRQKLKKERI